MTDSPWEPETIFWPRRCCVTGKLLWGHVMVRVVSGKRQYRDLTEDEDHDQWCDRQW